MPLDLLLHVRLCQDRYVERQNISVLQISYLVANLKKVALKMFGNPKILNLKLYFGVHEDKFLRLARRFPSANVYTGPGLKILI